MNIIREDKFRSNAGVNTENDMARVTVDMTLRELREFKERIDNESISSVPPPGHDGITCLKCHSLSIWCNCQDLSRIIHKENEMEQALYGFWKHDLFPYCLGGEIVKFDKDGTIETKGYGKGLSFKPLLIVPKEEGMRLNLLLDEIKQRRSQELDDLNKRFAADVGDIIRIPGRTT